MLTSAQVDAIREHVELDEPILRLVRLARTDLYEGPVHVTVDDDDDPYPGFVSACRMIREAIPRTDLYLDTASYGVMVSRISERPGPTGDAALGLAAAPVLNLKGNSCSALIVRLALEAGLIEAYTWNGGLDIVPQLQR